MLKSDVIRYYKTQSAAARAIGYSDGAVSQWGELIPELTARKYHDLTSGKLRFDPKLYKRAAAKRRAA